MFKKGNFSKAVLLFTILSFASYSFGAPCDYSDLYACQDNLDALKGKYSDFNRAFFDLNRQYSDLFNLTVDLNKQLSGALKERDYYKDLYENSPLDKLTVRDFYFYNDKIVYDINQTFNRTFNAFSNNLFARLTEVNNYVSIIFLLLVLEFVLLKINILNWVLRVRIINLLCKKINTTIFQRIKNSTTFKTVKNFIFIDEKLLTKNKEQPK
jgi:hypothetical protein